MADPHRIAGVIPVLPIPFGDDQAVDIPAFENMVQWTLARPVDGMALFGLASEYWKLSDDERLQLTESLIAAANRRKLVLVSVTDSTRYHAERFARKVASLGADGLIVMPPHFMSPKADRVIDHCRAVADAVAPLPVVVQYSPAYIGVSFTAEVFVRMQERSSNIGYVKVEPRPPGPMIDAIREASGGRMACLIGQGGLTLADCRPRGIAGIMPGVGVVEIYRQLWDGLAVEPVSEATWDLNDRMVALMSHIVPTIDMWVAADKQLLAWRGVIDRPLLREPSSLPEPRFFDVLRQCYQRLTPFLQTAEHP